MNTPLDCVLGYHQRTKHSLQRYAAGPDWLDWDSQPDPFRTFAGCARLELPLLGTEDFPCYAGLGSPDAIPPRAPDRDSIAALLELAFGLSAWKQYENSRWALRCNPSSGNLHPTEAYLVAQGCPGIGDGVHHYLSRDHVLEWRCRLDPSALRLLPPDSALVGLSSVHLRESWKYGERAFRYCQHDAGHAIAALSYAAAALGWQVRLLENWSDDDIAALLGLERTADFDAAETEHPDLMLLVTAGTAAGFDAQPLLHALRHGRWEGRANTLSVERPFVWPVIGEVARASRKPHTVQVPWTPPALPAPLPTPCASSAAALIKQRRSAQRFDGRAVVSAAAFHRMLDMTLPRPGIAPWNTIGWEPRIHPVLFVHRVEGLEPGLYAFPRNARGEALLRAQLSGQFEWLPVPGCPAHLPLRRLLAADMQKAARTLSCHQPIASHGAFSLGMLAEYESALTQHPWIYRQLFWEAGMLGQVLYLEAEAAGMRGTGIGCYFDDDVHDALGIPGRALQSMYHFTVGGPIMDDRLQTLEGYGHLPERQRACLRSMPP